MPIDSSVDYMRLDNSAPSRDAPYTVLRGLDTRPHVDKPKYRILSVDGGGILGLCALSFLEILERDTGKPCKELFNMLTGTSTGGIIAIGLAAGLPAS